MPGVIRANPESYLAIVGLGLDGKPAGINGNSASRESLDDTIQILEGHAFRGDDPFSVLVNEAFVKQFGKRVGDSVPGQMFSTRDLPAVAQGKYVPTGPKYTFHIVGIVRTPNDIALDEVRHNGDTAYGSSNQMVVPTAFQDRYQDEFLNFGESYNIRLANATVTVRPSRPQSSPRARTGRRHRLRHATLQ